MIVATQTARIGVRTLTYEHGRWFISIKNRSYARSVEITPEKAKVWKRQLAERR